MCVNGRIRSLPRIQIFSLPAEVYQATELDAAQPETHQAAVRAIRLGDLPFLRVLGFGHV
jgi:hypothetical protein